MIFPKPTSYYEKGFKRSPALERATAPFRVRNTLTGLGLIAFCGTVCTLLFSRISQLHGRSGQDGSIGIQMGIRAMEP